MDGLQLLLNGFVNSLTLVNLLACFVGALIGTVVGTLPGLGPTATMALLLPFTLPYGATTGLIMMTGVWYGAMYGGSTTSILVNIPGEAASVVTCLDGYAMCRKGRAGAALALVAIGSFVAGTIGILAQVVGIGGYPGPAGTPIGRQKATSRLGIETGLRQGAGGPAQARVRGNGNSCSRSP